MHYHAQFDEAYKVTTISQNPKKIVAENVVEIAEEQYDVRLLGTTYDPDARSYTGFSIQVEVDQNNVSVGTTVTITAKIYNYLNEFQSDDTREITFELDGEAEVVPAVNGEASTTLTPGVPGTTIFTISAPGCNSATLEVTAE